MKEEVQNHCRERKDKNKTHLSLRKPDDGDFETLARSSPNETSPSTANSSRAGHCTQTEEGAIEIGML